jgi:hypothetical protein
MKISKLNQILQNEMWNEKINKISTKESSYSNKKNKKKKSDKESDPKKEPSLVINYLLVLVDGKQQDLYISAKEEKATIQDIVGGKSELFRHDGHECFVNEDGYRQNLPLNIEASTICDKFLKGPVLFRKPTKDQSSFYVTQAKLNNYK